MNATDQLLLNRLKDEMVVLNQIKYQSFQLRKEFIPSISFYVSYIKQISFGMVVPKLCLNTFTDGITQ